MAVLLAHLNKITHFFTHATAFPPSLRRETRNDSAVLSVRGVGL
jgi:hypothetical protein